MKQTVYKYGFFLFFSFLLFLACSKGRLDDTWTLSLDVIQEGEGENDIPAIDAPQFALASAIDFLTDSSIVLGVNIDGVLKAYPVDVLRWHEIVNDEVGDTAVAITYATLTGSGIALHRRVENNILFKLKVSGLLYHHNLIAKDDVYDSHWIQFQRLAVNGSIVNTVLKEFPLIEMNWKAWRLLFPNSEVLTTNTGFNRPYETYPYGDFQLIDTSFLFDLTVPLDPKSQPISFKERVLGIIIDEDAKAYPFSAFPKTGLGVIMDEFKGQPIVVIGSQEHKLLVAYHRTRVDGSIASFEVADAAQLLIKDERGAIYDVFGKTIAGNATDDLHTIRSNMGYWFAWATFYPSVELYE